MSVTSIYCFISYSRNDTELARWLQDQLEAYRYPADLVSPELRPGDPARLRPVFLDSSDLPVSSGAFWNDICGKIDASRYLLVLCTRSSAASKYVDREIARFIGEDESRLDHIILAIIDPQINLSSPSPEDFPSEIYRRWEYFASRNHPRILPYPGESMSSARQRCLMQIISFMLGIEWVVLHNRHLIARRKKLLRYCVSAFAILVAISVSLALALVSSRNALEKERELTKFEREVFPFSLVVGYVDNFLSPLITSLDERPDLKAERFNPTAEREPLPPPLIIKPERPLIIIAIPNSYEELDHNTRVKGYVDALSKASYEPWRIEVKTTLPRGATTGIIVPTPPYYQNEKKTVYLDFASTVAAFQSVIDHKKENPAYAPSSKNTMLLQYADEFERSVKQRLKGRNQDDRIVFVRSPAAAMRILEGGQ